MAPPAYSAFPQELLLEEEPRRPGGQRPGQLRRAPRPLPCPPGQAPARLAAHRQSHRSLSALPLPEKTCRAEGEGLTHAGNNRGWPRASRWRGWLPCCRLGWWRPAHAGVEVPLRSPAAPREGRSPLGPTRPHPHAGVRDAGLITRAGAESRNSRAGRPCRSRAAPTGPNRLRGPNKGALCAGRGPGAPGTRRSARPARPHPSPPAVRPFGRQSVGPASRGARGRPRRPSGRSTPLTRRPVLTSAATPRGPRRAIAGGGDGNARPRSPFAGVTAQGRSATEARAGCARAYAPARLAASRHGGRGRPQPWRGPAPSPAPPGSCKTAPHLRPPRGSAPDWLSPVGSRGRPAPGRLSCLRRPHLGLE